MWGEIADGSFLAMEIESTARRGVSPAAVFDAHSGIRGCPATPSL
jgi:hypothetical protein